MGNDAHGLFTCLLLVDVSPDAVEVMHVSLDIQQSLIVLGTQILDWLQNHPCLLGRGAEDREEGNFALFMA